MSNDDPFQNRSRDLSDAFEAGRQSVLSEGVLVPRDLLGILTRAAEVLGAEGEGFLWADEDEFRRLTAKAHALLSGPVAEEADRG